MAFMKYENGFLKIKKYVLKDIGIDISDVRLELQNKTNGESAEALVSDGDGMYIGIQDENFFGKGYYIAVLSRKSTGAEIEKYGFCYGSQITVFITSKSRKDSKGITRCYLKLESTENVPENRIYMMFNDNSFFKLYFGEIKANKPVYYTFQEPETYVVCAEELDISEDVVTDGSHKIRDIEIKNITGGE